MNRSLLALSFCLFCPAGTSLAASVGESGLKVLPLTSAAAARRDEVLRAPEDFAGAEPFEARPGGAATVPRTSSPEVMGQASANLAPDRRLDFELGRALFEKLWVAAPASTKASDGLGPLYNARACAACHIRDGRGRAPSGAGDGAGSLLLKLSAADGSGPHPVYGGQLQDQAAPGRVAEGQIAVTYEAMPVTLADGTVVDLLHPVYGIADPGFGVLASGLLLSPRLAPAMTGLGLIEAIPSADILGAADPDDRDGDGISGRARLVGSADGERLGRFGLKAGAATVRDQVAIAFSSDMGLSTILFPDPWGDCTPAQATCRAGPHGQETGVRDGLEVDGQTLDLVAFYARNLAPPARPSADDPRLLAGKALFHAIGCAACHRPKYVTHRLADRPEHSFELIWPYSDFLLHDMGAGLADDRPEPGADGNEWRTPPLWAIGLARGVNPEAGFLHDGRARTLLEAVLWHGGEAAAARDRVIALTEADRNALIAFLESL